MTVTSADVAIRLRKENDELKATVKRLQEAYLPGNWEKLAEIKADNARLREALEEIANNGVNPRGEWTGFDHVKIAKASLAAKVSDKGFILSCGHTLQGEDYDCKECFPATRHAQKDADADG